MISATYSFFVGCSDGGREALKEAQGCPEDFDGIIVGSPVNDQVGKFGSSYLYDSQVILNGPQTGGVPEAYLTPIALSLAGNWGTWIPGSSPASPGLQYVLGYGFGCDLMQGVQTCDCLRIDVDQQDATARKTLQPILSSINPDLRPFKHHGRKMIHYVGWNDTAIAPQNSVNYYRTVERTMGNVRDFYRLFMVALRRGRRSKCVRKRDQQPANRRPTYHPSIN